ncbi:hypothetical protein J6590_013648, partial [Homalodisca vitripennis]
VVTLLSRAQEVYSPGRHLYCTSILSRLRDSFLTFGDYCDSVYSDNQSLYVA